MRLCGTVDTGILVDSRVVPVVVAWIFNLNSPKRPNKQFFSYRVLSRLERGVLRRTTHLCNAECLPRAGEHPRDGDVVGEVVEVIRFEAFGGARACHQLFKVLTSGKGLDGRILTQLTPFPRPFPRPGEKEGMAGNVAKTALARSNEPSARSPGQSYGGTRQRCSDLLTLRSRWPELHGQRGKKAQQAARTKEI